MRKLYLISSLFLSIFLVVWIFFIEAYFTDIPGDFKFESDIISIDNFFDVEDGEYFGGVYSKTKYGYEAVSEQEGMVSIKNTFDVRSPDNSPIVFIQRLYGIDKKTRAHISGFGDRDRDGYLFAPHHLKKGQSFTYWHANYDGPAHMTFVSEENLYGLNVYRYKTDYEGVTIDQTENLRSLPGVGVTRGVELKPHLTLWIEPITGRLVKYSDDTVAYFYDLQTHDYLYPWNHFSNTFQEDSVEKNVHDIALEKIKYQTVQVYVPFVTLILICLLLFFYFKKGSVQKPGRMLGIARNVLCGIVSCFIVVMFIGWIWDVNFITEFIVGNSLYLNPVTAMCCILLLSGMLFESYGYNRIAMIFGLFLTIVTLLENLSFFNVIPFDINQYFFFDIAMRYGQMTSFEAISLFLFSIGLFLHGNACVKRLFVREVINSTIFFLSILVLFGFLFEFPIILSYSTFFSVTPITACVFLLLSVHIGKSSRLILGIVSISLILSVLGAIVIERNFINEERSSFLTETERSASAIENRLEVFGNVLNGGKGLFAASEMVSRDEWKNYVDALNIQQNYSGIQGVGYAVFIKPEDLNAHIDSMRAEMNPDYIVYPEGQRDIYSSIIYLEPFNERNKRAFGFDMFQEKVRRLAMERARDTGKAAISGRVRLVQEISKEDEQPGFLVYVPVYRNDMPHETVGERREAIIGFVYSPFRAHDFIRGIFGPNGIDNVSLRIIDGTGESGEDEIYNDNKFQSENKHRFIATQTIYSSGRPWTLIFTSSQDYGQTFMSRLAPWSVMIFGMFVSVLIAFSLHTLISSRKEAVDYANEVTMSLSKAKTNLEFEKKKTDSILRFLRSIGDAVFAVDVSGNIIFMNSMAETLSERPFESVAGKYYKEVFHFEFEDVARKYPDFVENVIRTEKSQERIGRTILVSKNGLRTMVANNASPILDNKGELMGCIVVLQDVTRERELDRLKDRFLSVAAHQLRTPLGSMRWNMEMLLSGDVGEVNDGQKEIVQNIYDSSQRLVLLVNDLLNVSRIDQGKANEESSIVDIATVIEDNIKSLDYYAKKKNVSVSVLLADNQESYKALIAPKQFYESIQNLLSNALKYNKSGGKVVFELKKTGKIVRVAIRDTGIGIPKDEQSKIFGKFFRAKNAALNETEGTGLGLFVVKSFIEESGGKVWFESEENKGTTFFIELPIYA